MNAQSILSAIRRPGYIYIREPPPKAGLDLLHYAFKCSTRTTAKRIYNGLSDEQKAAWDLPRSSLHTHSYRVWEAYEVAEYVRTHFTNEWDPFRFSNLLPSEIFKDKLAKLRGSVIRDVMQTDPYDVAIKNALFTRSKPAVKAFRARSRFVNFCQSHSLPINDAISQFLTLSHSEMATYELPRKVTKSRRYNSDFLDLQVQAVMEHVKRYPQNDLHLERPFGLDDIDHYVYYNGVYLDRGVLTT